ncbi:hypothetical protein BDE02_13G123100 [Populus trichocarpa]|nr:hypothetical protein BDE02_13G123100 [Populus trichocarpa]
MPMMFFHFFKIIFDISTSKRSKKYKPYKCNTKQSRSGIYLNNQSPW